MTAYVLQYAQKKVGEKYPHWSHDLLNVPDKNINEMTKVRI